jgi:hypothetical protein
MAGYFKRFRDLRVTVKNVFVYCLYTHAIRTPLSVHGKPRDPSTGAPGYS